MDTGKKEEGEKKPASGVSVKSKFKEEKKMATPEKGEMRESVKEGGEKASETGESAKQHQKTLSSRKKTGGGKPYPDNIYYNVSDTSGA